MLNSSTGLGRVPVIGATILIAFVSLICWFSIERSNTQRSERIKLLLRSPGISFLINMFINLTILITGSVYSDMPLYISGLFILSL